MNTKPRELYINKCDKFTMTSRFRMQLLWDLIEKELDNDYPLLEAGVYRGGSCMLMAYALNEFNKKNDIYMLDTFRGMTRPEPIDTKAHKGNTYDKRWTDNQEKDSDNKPYTDWCYAPLKQVKDNMKTTNFNNKVFYIEGDVVDTVPKGTDKIDKISILRLDTDFYKSTKHLMDNLFHKVVDGGYVIFDDYNCWKGSKKAVDEYFKKNGLDIDKIKTCDHSCSYYKKGD